MPKNWIIRALLLLALAAGAAAAAAALLQREPIAQIQFTAAAAAAEPFASFSEVTRIGITAPREVALSPDGRLLAVASASGLWLQELDRPNSLRLLSGYELANQPYKYTPADDISSIAFSPDGRYLAFITDSDGARQNAIDIWDVASGNVQTRIVNPTRHCTFKPQLAYSADGARLLTFDPSSICLWSVETGQREQLVRVEVEPYQAGLRRAALSPDGRYIVSITWTGRVQLWDAADGAELLSAAGDDAAFGPNNLLLVVSRDEGQIRLLDLETLTERLVLAGRTAAFSPDGARIAAVGDSDIALWSVEGAELRRISLADPERENFAPDIRAVAFSPDGARLLATGVSSWPNKPLAYVWAADTGDLIWSYEAADPSRFTFSEPSFNDDRVNQPIVVQETHAALIISAAHMIVWDFAQESASVVDLPCLSSGSVISRDRELVGAAFSPDGAQIMTACLSDGVLLWDAAGSAFRRLPLNVSSLNVSSSTMFDAAVSPDGSHYLTLHQTFNAAGRRSGMAALWNAEGEAVHAFTSAELFDADFSPDGAELVFGNVEGRLELYAIAERQTRLTLGSPDSSPLPTYFVRYSPDGTRFVTLSPDHQARIWSANDGTAIATLPHQQRILAAAFSPDGSQVATADEAGVIRLWSAADGQRQASYQLPDDSDDGDIVNDLAFSPDGQRLTVALRDRQVWVLDANTGALAGLVGRHRGMIYSAAFSPDGSRLLTVGADNTARVWALPGLTAARAD